LKRRRTEVVEAEGLLLMALRAVRQKRIRVLVLVGFRKVKVWGSQAL